MNEKYQIKSIEQNNRGLFSKKIFKKAEQILQLQPIAWATIQSVKTTICNWCLLQKQLFKCSECKSFYYCSQQCQKKDWKYHKMECKVFKKMMNEKNLSILKTLTSEFVFNIRLFFVLNQNKDLSQNFYKMASLEDYQPLQKKQYFQELSLVMMENLSLQKNEENMSKILKQLNIVAVNAFTIQDLFYLKDGVAIGIFSPANYINHDCNPNCVQIFDGRYLKIISQKQINSGQELTISYTNSLQLYNNRKQFLRQNYFFECFCQLCQIQRMMQVQVRYIHCPQCNQLQIRKIKKKDIQEWHQDLNQNQEVNEKQKIYQNYNKQEAQSRDKKQEYFECQGCHKQIDNLYLKQLTKAIQLLPSQMQSLQYKKGKKKLFQIKKKVNIKHPFFCKCLQILLQKSIIAGVQQQKNQELQKKIFQQSYILLLQIINNLKFWYRLDEGQELSMRFWIKYNQMGKLCHTLNKMQKSFNYTEKAVNIIKSINLRNQYSEIKDMYKRYQQLKIEMSIAKSNAFKSSK